MGGHKLNMATAIRFLIGLLVYSQMQGVYAQQQSSTVSFQLPITGEPTIVQNVGVYDSGFCGNHLGQDLRASVGTSVYAISDGVVKFAGSVDCLGDAVHLEHTLPDGSKAVSLYYHIVRGGAKKIKQGDLVSVGELLGQVMNLPARCGTGPHLHFGIRKGDYKSGSDPRTERWYYPGYSSIRENGVKICDKSNPKHSQITSEWLLNPVKYITGMASSKQIFSDDFSGTTLDTDKWTVESAGGTFATYAESGGYLNITVNGGSCGRCGIGDGILLKPKVDALAGDFEYITSFEEILRQKSWDGTGTMGNLQMLLYGPTAATQVGVYVVGDVKNNSGTPGHTIIRYSYAGGSLVYQPERQLTVGQYYALQFRIRRSSGAIYLGYKVQGDAGWTEDPVPSAFPVNTPFSPRIYVSTGDGGGTVANSVFKARIDSVTISVPTVANSSGALPAISVPAISEAGADFVNSATSSKTCTFTASGQWGETNGIGVATYYSPLGLVGNLYAATPLPTANSYGLIASYRGAYVFVGNSWAGQLAAGERIKFLMNDTFGAFYNNVGALTVSPVCQ